MVSATCNVNSSVMKARKLGSTVGRFFDRVLVSQPKGVSNNPIKRVQAFLDGVTRGSKSSVEEVLENLQTIHEARPTLDAKNKDDLATASLTKELFEDLVSRAGISLVKQSESRALPDTDLIKDIVTSLDLCNKGKRYKFNGGFSNEGTIQNAQNKCICSAKRASKDEYMIRKAADKSNSNPRWLSFKADSKLYKLINGSFLEGKKLSDMKYTASGK